jgi:hypothetical protein
MEVLGVKGVMGDQSRFGEIIGSHKDKSSNPPKWMKTQEIMEPLQEELWKQWVVLSPTPGRPTARVSESSASLTEILVCRVLTACPIDRCIDPSTKYPQGLKWWFDKIVLCFTAGQYFIWKEKLSQDSVF